MGNGSIDSRIPEFYKKSVAERRKIIRDSCNLSEEGCQKFEKGLPLETANSMIENVIGTHPLPLGVALNFKVNGRDYIIPMAVEEASVVAAASNAAKLCRESGGFTAEADEPVMIGQLQIMDVPDMEAAIEKIKKEKETLIKKGNEMIPVMVKLGGGVKDIELRRVSSKTGDMLIIHFLVDVRDSMGANTINTVLERMSPEMESITSGKAGLRILSNLAVKRMARARAVWKKDVIGEDAVAGVLDAWAFADADPYRAATHNKGIMNGIDAAVIATGNDWRAIEAGAHAYAAMNGRYKPLTRYRKEENGDLVGEIELPLALGIVGGATKTHPMARLALKMLNVKSAMELACVIASLGLAQNFAALKALSTEGIQKGHMRLHCRNIAIAGGAKDAEIDLVAERMMKESNITIERANEILRETKK